MCIKSEVKGILLKLATNHRPKWWGLPADIENFALMGCLSLPKGQYMYKIMKNMHKIRGHSRAIFWNMQPVTKVIRPFCFHQKIVPIDCLLLPWGYIYMYDIKQNIILNNEPKGIFLELVQNDGNNKSFKMLSELVPSGCMPMLRGFFFKWLPCVGLDHFYDRVKFVSWCFCMGDRLYSIEYPCTVFPSLF